MFEDTLPLSLVRDKLSELVDDAVTTHHRFTITRKGVPAAVLLSADDWEALQETLFWLSEPGTREAVERADPADPANLDEQAVRQRFGTAGR